MNKRRITSLLLAFVMLLSLSFSSLAIDEDDSGIDAVASSFSALEAISADESSEILLATEADEVSMDITDDENSSTVEISETPIGTFDRSLARASSVEVAPDKFNAVGEAMAAPRASATVPINVDLAFNMQSDGIVELTFTIPSTGKIDLRMQNASSASVYDLYLCDVNNNIYAYCPGALNDSLTRIYGTIGAGTYKAIILCAGSTYDPSSRILFYVLHNASVDGFELDDNHTQAHNMSLYSPMALSRTIDTWSDVDHMQYTVSSTRTVLMELSSTTTAGRNGIAVLMYKLQNGNLIALELNASGQLVTRSNQSEQTFALGAQADNQVYSIIFPAGTYVFAVQASTTTAAGQPYVFGLRPLSGTNANIIHTNRGVTYYTIGNQAYLNNVAVGDSWERNFIFSYPDGGYKKRNLSLTEINKGLINWNGNTMLTRAPQYVGTGSYTSQYAGTYSNATILALGNGTHDVNNSALWLDWQSNYVNGGPLTGSTLDTLNIAHGPSRLDWRYMVLDRTYWVVIDNNTGKVVDFLSDLNPYYSTGTPETWSFVRQF